VGDAVDKDIEFLVEKREKTHDAQYPARVGGEYIRAMS